MILQRLTKRAGSRPPNLSGTQQHDRLSSLFTGSLMDLTGGVHRLAFTERELGLELGSHFSSQNAMNDAG